MADARPIVADLAVRAPGSAVTALIIYTFTTVAVLSGRAIVVVFTFQILLKKARRTDTDCAASIDAFFAVGTNGIASLPFVFAGFIDANLIIRTFCAGIFRTSRLAGAIDAFFLCRAFGAGIFGIVANASHAGLLRFALAAWIAGIVAYAVVTGLFRLALAAWIAGIVAYATDAGLL